MHDFLTKKLNENYDKDTVNNIIDGLKCEKKTTFRVNLLKSNSDVIEDNLKRNNILFTRCNVFNDVYIIDSKYKNILEFLSIYKDGKIYLQSISSMMPVYALNPKANENILDMCAAPGSKTTLIQSIASNKVNLTAVELHRDRFERLKYNINLQGANVYALNKSAYDLDDNLKFDKILIDAPCSGSGILDVRDVKYEKYFTDDLILKCTKTQRRLIEKASRIIRKYGVVIYSTCSILKEENENMIQYALDCGFEVDTIKDLCIEKNIMNDTNFVKILPSDIYEGFFVTKLIKK